VGDTVKPLRGVAIALIAAGALALAYGGFSYTKKTHEGHIGSLDLSIKDKEHVNIPVWAGVGAIVIGVGFLLVPTGKI
jgi:TRAP-type C4-dicarboxylate transport system permease small subunit